MNGFFDFDIEITKKIPKGWEKYTKSAVIHGNVKTADFVILTSEMIPILIYDKIKEYFEGRRVAIVYIYKIVRLKPENKIVGSVLNFNKHFSINIGKYILPHHKCILTMGSALYALTKNTTMLINTFYDTHGLNDTRFFSGKHNKFVYPIEYIENMYDYKYLRINRGYASEHLKSQIGNAMKMLNSDYFSDSYLGIGSTEVRIEKVDDIDAFFDTHKDEEYVAWDLETGGFNFQNSKIKCITMSFDGITGYYIDWNNIKLRRLDRFLKGKKQIGANLKFDCKFLRKMGVHNAIPYFDTLQAGHVLNEMRSNSLKTHAWIYTKHGGYDDKLEELKKDYPHYFTEGYYHVPEKILKDYATMDAIVCFQVYERQLELLGRDRGLYNYFFNQVMPTLLMFIDIELEGLCIDWDKVREAERNINKAVKSIEEEIYKIVGKRFNIASVKELGEVLKLVLKLPPSSSGLNQRGGYKTDEDSLLSWSKEGYEIADKLLKYREYSTIQKMFIGSEELKTCYWEYKEDNGRIYPLYSVMLASSHRFKAKHPNIQQIVKRGEYSKIVRSFFTVPSKDYYMCEIDYSGLQLRIAGMLSGDEKLYDAFNKYGGDIHSITAQQVFCPHITLEEFLLKKKEEPYSDYRYQSKGINFGFLFGMSHITFANTVIRKEWSLVRCKEFCKEHNLELELRDYKDENSGDYFITVAKYLRDKFFKTYSRIKLWHETTKDFALYAGYVKSMYGAKRLLPQLLCDNRDNKGMEANLINIAINSPVQNAEVVLISRAMVHIHKYFNERGMKSKISAMIHDAVVFYIHKDEYAELKTIIPEIMTRDYSEYKGIKLEVEGDYADVYNGEVWGYGKEWGK